MIKREIRAPILVLFFLSLGGLLLHIRIHPPDHSVFNWTPVVFGVLGTAVLPWLFNYRRTMPWAYLLNLAAVVVGTVTMAWHTATHWEGAVTWQAVLLRSTLADIVILLAKLPPAHQILRHFRPAGPGQRVER